MTEQEIIIETHTRMPMALQAIWALNVFMFAVLSVLAIVLLMLLGRFTMETLPVYVAYLMSLGFYLIYEPDWRAAREYEDELRAKYNVPKSTNR